MFVPNTSAVLPNFIPPILVECYCYKSCMQGLVIVRADKIFWCESFSNLADPEIANKASSVKIEMTYSSEVCL